MREKKPKLASFILISLMLASIFAGAVGGAGVGEVEDGAEEERAHINSINAGLPTTSFLKTQTPFLFMPNDNSLSSKIDSVQNDQPVFLFSTTVTLTPVADATIDYISPNTNFGTQDTLEVQYQSSRQMRRTLLRFNLAAAVPSDAIIDLARLDLYLEGSQGPDSINLVAARLTEDWIESQVTWNNRPATGDPVEASLVDTTVSPVRVDVTDIVRAWHNVPHYGLELRGPEGETVYNLIFESREHGEMLPQLTMTYHLPSPTYTFTGNVYQGSPPDTNTPTGGVTVELWDDEDEWPEAGSERVRLFTTTTDDAGAFSLSWEGGDAHYPYLHVIELDPPGTYSTGAQAEEPGYVKNFNVVSYLDIPPGTYDGIAFWDQMPVEKPDLNIIEVWNESGRICYHIQNIGEAVAPGGHCTALFVDGVYRVEDCVEEDIAPGAGLARCFEYGRECTPPEDVIRVCADHRGDIEERDEENNYVERIFECAPEEKPDLIITDVWSEDGTICYQIRNIGEAEAPGGHYTALFVDDEYRVSDLVDKSLEPGERWKGCFDYEWVCTPPEDIIAVAADYEEDVAEDNKTNNRREEIWKCDTTAPEITHGPTVHEVTQNSAVIFWETHEDSDSVVKYGKTARMYASEETDSTMVREHSVTLSDLEPSTTYNFVVQSTDPGRNSVQSKDKIFATLPLSDDEDPTVSIIDPGVCRGTVTISAEAFDNIGVEKVEFFFGEKLVFTDFLEEQSYRLAKLRLDTTKYKNGEYTLKAKAYDLSGRYVIDVRIIRLFNVIDVTAPSVNITSPGQWDTVSGTINITADLSDDTGMDAAVFYVDGVKKSVESFHFPHNTTSKTVHFSWDTTHVKNGAYRIGIRAWDVDGKNGTDTVDVTVYNPLEVTISPYLVITKHEVTRHQNGFVIELTVKNEGFADATNVYIRDFLRSFQPISRTTTVPVSAEYEAKFHGSSWTSSMDGVCCITDNTDIAPGDSHTYTFGAIPVLVYLAHSNPPKPSIGDYVRVWYEGKDGTEHFAEYKNKVLHTTGNVPIATAYENALKEADYLIMTNPYRLFSLPDSANVDDLLSEMAQLAVYKEGVLGYAYTQSELKIQKLIRPSGDWAKKLSSDFSKPIGGYLLIVGETEIVPAHSIPQKGTGPIHHSDHPYSDTFGNDDQPELAVGRIIGNDAAKLSKAIKTSIGIYEGSSGYGFDHSDALVVSGNGGGTYAWADEANQVADVLDDEFSVDKLLCTDHFNISSFYAGFSKSDGLAVGNVLGDAKGEIIIGDKSTDKIYVYNASGAKQQDFYCGYGGNDFEEGDRIAVGNYSIVLADSSANRILVYNGYGVLQTSFELDFEGSDGLAAGDVIGNNHEEIVVADASADKIYIYNVNGVKLGEFSGIYGVNDGFAVGNVLGAVKDQIFTASAGSSNITVVDYAGNLKGYFKGGFTANDGFAAGDVLGNYKDEILVARDVSERVDIYHCEIPHKKTKREFMKAYSYKASFTANDGFAAGDVLGGKRAEVLIADYVSGAIYLSSPICGDRLPPLFKSKAVNKDVIFFSDHGNQYCWSDVIGTSDFPISFGNTNPLLFASACSTGNYDPKGDYGIAEAFFDSGAAVYIGSTVPYGSGPDPYTRFFKKLVKTSKPISRAFIETEKDLVQYYKDYTWVREFNLYGDPKIGATKSVSAASSQMVLAEEPLSFCEVVLPDYEVTSINGLDYVEISGGMSLFVDGKPRVPFYSVDLEYPAGYEIQDVLLTDRSGLITATGLNIPIAELIVRDMYAEEQDSKATTSWYPEEDYRWDIMENPDGTSTLIVIMYPFHYNPLTTDVRFYKNYSFEINYTVSPVAITSLATDKDEYEQGDTVMVDIGLNNSGEAQDVVVSASVRRYDSGDIVDGLLLRTLKDFAGLASFSPQWDSSGIEPGYYFVEVTLKDTGGDVLDRRTEMFRLGISSGEITSFTATPEHFDIGDDIEINMIFNNNGTVNITGTAITRIINSTGYAVEEFGHNVTDLIPSELISFSDTWNTSVAEECSYNILGYVLYDSKATEPMTVTIFSCVIPTDDLYINSDTALCPGVYNIPDSGAEGVIIINASNVVLDCNGAIINGTMTGSDYGIYSRDYDNVTIKNCNVMNYLAGIELEMSSDSTITHNNLSFNRYGIYLFYSDDSMVTNNNANSNKYKGIGLASSSNNLVTNNNANKNGDGIFLGPMSSNNKIAGNNASSNKQAGIYIYGDSSSNNFSNNEINDNLYGIYLSPCICPTCSHYCPGGNFNNTIKLNEILNNEIGIFSNQSNSMIDLNRVCDNIESDFNSSNWLSSSGDNNTCDKPNGWNDAGTTGCTYTCPIEKPDLKIRDLKGPDWSRYVGKEVTVEGIFVRDPLPMLVTDLDIVRVNMPMPDDQYILLIGNDAEEIDPRSCGGAKIRLKGLVAEIDDSSKYGDEYVAIESISYEMLERLEEYAPEIIYIETYPELQQPHRYAILFSGGIKPADNHIRYWNDLKFMYSTLVNEYGYTNKTIAVLYADGKAPVDPKTGQIDKQTPVHYSATQTNLQTVFNLLKGITTPQDFIFVFTTNHGGGFCKAGCKIWGKTYYDLGGQLDTNGDEPAADVLWEQDCKMDLNGDGFKTGQVSWDEELCSWGGSIFDDSFPNMLANLKYARMVILMEQCFSGGLIADMAGSNRIIMSAAGEYEPSYAMGPYPYDTYDEFSYYFTCAINGADPKGKTVNADANGDGEVSMVEAFNYARAKDTQSETPWYEDSGDGVPHSGKMPAGGDGTLGSNTSLEW